MGFRKEINRNRGNRKYEPKLVTNMRLDSKDCIDYVGVVLLGNLTNVTSSRKSLPPTPSIWFPTLGECIKLKNHLLSTFKLDFSPNLKVYSDCHQFRLNARFYFSRDSIIENVIGNDVNGVVALEMAWLRVCPVFLPLKQFRDRDILYKDIFSTIKDYLIDKDYVALSLDGDNDHSLKYKTISDWINGKISEPISEIGLYSNNDWGS